MSLSRLLVWSWALLIGIATVGWPTPVVAAPQSDVSEQSLDRPGTVVAKAVVAHAATPSRPAAKPTATPKPKTPAPVAPKPAASAKPKAPTPAQQAQAFYRNGAQAYAQGQMLEAAEAFQQAVSLQSHWPDAFYYLGLTYYSLGQYDLALAAFTEAQAQYKQPHAETLFGMGLSQYALRQLPAARGAFVRAVAATASDELKTTAESWIQVLDGELERQAIEQALAADPGFHTAIEQYERGEFMAAVASFQQTLAKYPRSTMVQYYLGASNYQMTRYQEAIQAFQRVIELEPKSQYAKDAQLFIDSIRSMQQSRAGRPFSFFASVGSGYDSNVSYGNGAQILPDATSQLMLSASYRLSPHLQAQYSLGANANFGLTPPVAGYTSQDFNLMSHTGGLLWDWPISRLLTLGGDYQLSWYLLGGQSYLVDHRLQPRLQWLWHPSLVSRVYAVIQSSQFPRFTERSSVNSGLGVSTAWQLPFLPGALLTGGYDLLNVAANDHAITEQVARLDDGTPYALRSRLAASYLGHGPYLGFDWQLWSTTVRLTSRLQWLGFTKPDYYQLTYFQGEQALPPSLNTDKLRADRLITLTAEVIQPLSDQLFLSLQGSYYLNDSNIVATDYLDRSFRKGLLLANLQYVF